MLIRFDPAVTNALRLLQILERERRRPALPDLETSHSATGWIWPEQHVTGTGDRWRNCMPALLPVCAILLVGSNLKTFRVRGPAISRRTNRASRALCQHCCCNPRQWTVHCLGRDELDVRVLAPPVLQRIEKYANESCWVGLPSSQTMSASPSLRRLARIVEISVERSDARRCDLDLRGRTDSGRRSCRSRTRVS